MAPPRQALLPTPSAPVPPQEAPTKAEPEVVDVPHASKFFSSNAAARRALLGKLNLTSLIEYIDHLREFRATNSSKVAKYQKCYGVNLRAPSAEQQKVDSLAKEIERKMEAFQLKRLMTRGIDGVVAPPQIPASLTPAAETHETTKEEIGLTLGDQVKPVEEVATNDKSPMAKLPNDCGDSSSEETDGKLVDSSLCDSDEEDDSLEVTISDVHHLQQTIAFEADEDEKQTAEREEVDETGENLEPESTVQTDKAEVGLELALPTEKPVVPKLLIPEQTEEPKPRSLVGPSRDQIRDGLINELQARLNQLELNIKQQQEKVAKCKVSSQKASPPDQDSTEPNYSDLMQAAMASDKYAAKCCPIPPATAPSVADKDSVKARLTLGSFEFIFHQ